MQDGPTTRTDVIMLNYMRKFSQDFSKTLEILGEWTNLTGRISPIVRFWLILKSQFIPKKLKL
jgi:hypothetical protein